MEKPKFTPGPWSFRTDRTTGDNGIVAEGTGVFAEAFADIRHAGERNTGEALANTHLISAAPDMYEVVRLVVERMDAEEMSEADVDDFMAGWTEIHEKARAALSKANGEGGDQP